MLILVKVERKTKAKIEIEIKIRSVRDYEINLRKIKFYKSF